MVTRQSWQGKHVCTSKLVNNNFINDATTYFTFDKAFIMVISKDQQVVVPANNKKHHELQLVKACVPF